MKKRDLILDEYNISKHRYRELYNYCLQYPEWLEKRRQCYSHFPISQGGAMSKNNYISNPTARNAEYAIELTEKMKIIEQTAIEADAELYPYILKAVTEGKTWEVLQPPCGVNQFREVRRKFFYLLDLKKR